MKSSFQSWLNRAASIPGVLAGAIQFQDRTAITMKPATQYPEAAVERSVRCAVETFHVLNLHRTRARTLRFVYRAGCVYASLRPDSVCLALLTRVDRTAVNTAEVNRLLNEFLLMGAANN